MTGPQQSRPSPAPRDAGGETPRPSPRPRHGRDDDAGDRFPGDSYQGVGYPDLRPSRPVERPAPWTRGGYPDPPLYGEQGAAAGADPAQPAGYAAPTRYDGHGTPEPAGVAQPGPATQQYDTTTGAHDRPAYGGPAHEAGYGEPDRYGSAASRGGLAIDGGPPYRAPAERSAQAAPAGAAGAGEGAESGEAGPDGSAVPVAGTFPAGGAAGGPGTGAAVTGAAVTGAAATGAAATGSPATGVADDGRATAALAAPERPPAQEPAAAAASIPAQRAPERPDPAGTRTRPTTVAEAAAARGFPDRDRGERVPVAGGKARDPRALTVLRVVTYLLVSLCCLLFLAAAVYAGIGYLQFRDALNGVPFLDGGLPGTGPG